MFNVEPIKKIIEEVREEMNLDNSYHNQYQVKRLLDYEIDKKEPKYNYNPFNLLNTDGKTIYDMGKLFGLKEQRPTNEEMKKNDLENLYREIINLKKLNINNFSINKDSIIENYKQIGKSFLPFHNEIENTKLDKIQEIMKNCHTLNRLIEYNDTLITMKKAYSNEIKESNNDEKIERLKNNPYYSTKNTMRTSIEVGIANDQLKEELFKQLNEFKIEFNKLSNKEIDEVLISYSESKEKYYDRIYAQDLNDLKNIDIKDFSKMFEDFDFSKLINEENKIKLEENDSFNQSELK